MMLSAISREDRQAALSLRDIYPAARVAARMGWDELVLREVYRRSDAQKKRLKSLNDTPKGYQRIYNEGRAAHHRGLGIDNCPYTDKQLGKACSWKAGWADADIEAGNSVIAGRV